MRPPVLIVPPVAPPVTVDEVRRHARIDHNHEDDVIAGMIDGAVSLIDGWHGILGRAIMPQTWRQEFDAWGVLRLALPDVQSLTVTYRDDAGDMQPAVDAELGADALGAFVTAEGPASGLVRVDYVCALPDRLRPLVRQAIILQVAALDADRIGADGLSPGAMAMVDAIRWRQV